MTGNVDENGVKVAAVRDKEKAGDLRKVLAQAILEFIYVRRLKTTTFDEDADKVFNCLVVSRRNKLSRVEKRKYEHISQKRQNLGARE